MSREIDARIMTEIMLLPDQCWGKPEEWLNGPHPSERCAECHALSSEDEELAIDFSKTHQRQPLYYSSDIALAWLVVEKLRGQNIYIELSVPPPGSELCTCELFVYSEYSGSAFLAKVESENMPLAICEAALKVAECVNQE